jgi:DnaK suppressor protein
MKRAELRKFRMVLDARRTDLVDRVQARLASLQVDSVGDRMDAVRGMVERNAVADDVARMSHLLELVEAACKRIDRGTFGVCLACGDEMPRRRLKFVPWAPYCVACQNLSERAQLDVAKRPFPETLAS